MTPRGEAKPRIAYLVHDLNDPAVHRRLAMLEVGGADVDLLGFHRGETLSDKVKPRSPVSLGRTTDANLYARAFSVIKALLRLPRWIVRLRSAEAVVARNLETLVLAAAARLVARGPPYVYEMLDVHTIMTGRGSTARLMRGLEGWLLRHASGIIVSSPAFVSAHLAHFYTKLPSIHLVENKLFWPEGKDNFMLAPPSPPAWRIGWFGNLRCAESLEALVDLAHRLGPQVEIHMRGTIARSIQNVFAARVADVPNIEFHGLYHNPDDLAAIYGGVHFSWAIDFYEDGLNSAWLLPNRLYEGCAFGCVPIALEGVETAVWLRRHGLGLILPGLEDLTTAISGMTLAAYEAQAGAVRRAPPGLFEATPQDCKALVSALLQETAANGLRDVTRSRRTR